MKLSDFVTRKGEESLSPVCLPTEYGIYEEQGFFSSRAAPHATAVAKGRQGELGDARPKAPSGEKFGTRTGGSKKAGHQTL